ncbi:Rpn family recombination-promoting nuclease/putative transposase [Lamprobacter modestohalophilus]|uniref:Rpn family recombination-promoting nuclease/putative transposase n=1 Tax=Lamprobacter modestohalophilus TaxID=1064514 RepID=UPI002ADED02B|nr:Rpn family recombination-promoting nuclease/putative transposase [Lamprobacter modestohalophilus]MEA1048247.1 Rpn family recombination-promoting nuclease/putative transposase [Lamprobacter modestohalophilus]
MRHHIDPKIDCVFKALLGAEANRCLLIHFLNAMLGADLPAPITTVDILNPYNEREFLDDKLSVVDVKARDDYGGLHQVEIQLLTYRDLPARISYGWADLYSSQLNSGETYAKLKPTYAIWLLAQDLICDSDAYLHDFRLRDVQGLSLVEHGGIWVLELNKFHAELVETEQERWLKFFKEGASLDSEALPPWMQTPEMRQAMSTLERFSEKDRAYHAYQARQNYLRQQMSIQQELDERRAEAERERLMAEQARQNAEQARQSEEQARQSEEQARQSEEQARQSEEQARQSEEQTRMALEQERAAKESALAEVERLKAQLRGSVD